MQREIAPKQIFMGEIINLNII